MHQICYATLLGIVSIVSSSLLAQSAPSENSSGKFAISATYKIGGDGRWDYLTVDADHHLYVTRSTHTQVIDGNNGKVIADIAGGSGLHGTVLVPSVQRGFITDGEDAKLLVIDLETNTLAGKIDAADDADGIIYDEGTDRVLVSCGDAGQLLVLDPKSEITTAKVDKIDLDGKPEFLAADGMGHAFVCMNDKNLIAEIDLAEKKVINRWPCGTGTAPTGLAIDPKNKHLFVGCRNQKMIIMNSTDGKVLAELPIGQSNDACAFDAGMGQVFASCGDSTVTVVRETTPGMFVVAQTISTKPGARTMALDPSNHTLYLPTADFAPAEQGKRPAALPNTFGIVVVAPVIPH